MLLGAADGLREEMGFAVYDPEERDRIVSDCQARLGRGVFIRRSTEGRRLTLKQAADLALESVASSAARPRAER